MGHRRLSSPTPLAAIEAEVVDCRACPRLVAWREQVAAEKRAAYRDEVYWGRPVPGFGDPAARIVVIGLAPAAHGGNRTGRVFTGDRSGDFLFAAMHRTGLANQPTSVRAGDGLALHGVWVTASVKCAPPANAPTPAERDACAPFLLRELAALEPAVIVCLGAFGYEAACRAYAVRPRPRFAHGAEVAVDGGPVLLCSFHPSQQNTFTGRLTADMLEDVFRRAAELGAIPAAELGAISAAELGAISAAELGAIPAAELGAIPAKRRSGRTP
jgi:uracil-DNA glycosylase family 4